MIIVCRGIWVDILAVTQVALLDITVSHGNRRRVDGPTRLTAGLAGSASAKSMQYGAIVKAIAKKCIGEYCTYWIFVLDQ